MAIRIRIDSDDGFGDTPNTQIAETLRAFATLIDNGLVDPKRDFSFTDGNVITAQEMQMNSFDFVTDVVSAVDKLTLPENLSATARYQEYSIEVETSREVVDDPLHFENLKDALAAYISLTLLTANQEVNWEISLSPRQIPTLRDGSPAPKFCAIAFDRTSTYEMNTPEERERLLNILGGKIFDVYLYDRRKQVHACEITPSYELHYVYSVGNILETSIVEWSEKDREWADEQLRAANTDTDVMYVHCHSIDTRELPSDTHVCCLDYADEDPEELEELTWENTLEEATGMERANPTF